ncbi:hypothetical protein BO71DRAFT_124641 [Aspergillus ellipticus CBS 707.79]|uniref:Uncharacterized protein n=1 Tax=Aspergillus ellipticus CBS 707.79 TaxID=1448320 RepID=A0A319D2X5_9EURO|nr:hypothetical protein BO71DRAFT_124641 [Aspergillus ellipticus CBS 707.79]
MNTYCNRQKETETAWRLDCEKFNERENGPHPYAPDPWIVEQLAWSVHDGGLIGHQDIREAESPMWKWMDGSILLIPRRTAASHVNPMGFQHGMEQQARDYFRGRRPVVHVNNRYLIRSGRRRWSKQRDYCGISGTPDNDNLQPLTLVEESQSSIHRDPSHP